MAPGACPRHTLLLEAQVGCAGLSMPVPLSGQEKRNGDNEAEARGSLTVSPVSSCPGIGLVS